MCIDRIHYDVSTRLGVSEFDDGFCYIYGRLDLGSKMSVARGFNASHQQGDSCCRDEKKR